METSRVAQGLWSLSEREPAFAFSRERRMHARAYDHWVSLLHGRRMPLVADLDPATMGALAGHSVLVRVAETAGGPGPSIAFIGEALRAEAEIVADVPGIEDVSTQSLLGQLLAHFADIVAHRAPVGFEAEHQAPSGVRTLHRGILLPFADADGGINWKTIAEVAELPDIAAAVDVVGESRPRAAGGCAWGDGPGAAIADDLPPPQPLSQQLAAARTWAALAVTDRTRGAASLHAALGAAHDFLIAARADATGFAGLADTGDLAQPAHAVRLVFGAETGRRDRAAFVAVLRHALRLGLGRGGLADLLDRYAGGHAALAQAERRARRLARRAQAADAARAELAQAPVIGEIALIPVDPDFLLLIGRRAAASIELVARVPDAALTEAALARVRAA